VFPAPLHPPRAVAAQRGGKFRRQALDQYLSAGSSGQAQAGLVDPLPTLGGRGHAQR
jgi:hypothetical protein